VNIISHLGENREDEKTVHLEVLGNNLEEILQDYNTLAGVQFTW
jgi:hypothetical protein